MIGQIKSAMGGATGKKDYVELLSMPNVAIPRVKWVLRRVPMNDARADVLGGDGGQLGV